MGTYTNESYWMETAAQTAYPPLAGDVDVDVVVIGGGIAGLCTAWELTEAGQRVALVEADRIAAGVTGYTTAKLSVLHTLVYATIRKSLGPDAARMYATSQQQAVERVFAVASRLNIDCDLERVPAFTWTESPEQLDRIRAEADAATKAGLPASFVADTGLPFAVAGAVRVEGQAQFHPRKYLLALARDLTARGGQIFERTRATGLHDGGPCTMTTEGGQTITAGQVVIATHYPVFDRALMFARLEARRELVVAGTIPADRDPGGVYLTAEQNTRSVRTAPTGNVCSSSLENTSPPAPATSPSDGTASSPGPGNDSRVRRSGIAGPPRTTRQPIRCRSSDVSTPVPATSTSPPDSVAGE
jgi:glycine/D-amino acid oxidase-like deaminating enzyme